MDPFIRVLRLVGGDEKPMMGYIYQAMENTKQQVKENFDIAPLK